jgi:glycosyltransferase involved in cell wall biosynthesis
MNILLINHYAGSDRHGMEYRPYYLSREWTRLGHNVTIVAASASHLRVRAPAIEGNLTQEFIDGIRYLWLRTPSYTGNGVSRAGNIFAFLCQLQRYGRRIAAVARPDSVIASSTYPLDTLVAHRFSRQSDAKFIYEVHDLWPLSLIELAGMSPRHPFVMLLQWAENFAYRHCDEVVSMLPNAASYMQKHGLAPHKFTYVPNGVQIREWEREPQPLPVEHQVQLAALKEKGCFIVGYAGGHGLANALETLIDAAHSLKELQIAFLLVGQGPAKAALQARAYHTGLTNTLFLPPVPKQAVPTLLGMMDAVYLGCPRKPIYRYGISPNKLFDYMMAGRPIVLAAETGNDLATASGCSITVPPEDPVAVAEAIKQLASLSRAEREAMGAKGRAYVLAHHDYRTLARRFLQVLE